METRKMRLFLVVVVAVIGFSQLAIADTEFWSAPAFRFPVREKVKFEVIPEIRVRNNLSDLYYFRTYIGPSLSLSKNFGVNIYYAPNYVKSSNSWTALGYLDAIYKTSFPWFSFSNRGRFEYDFTPAVLKYRNLFWFGREGWFASDELFYNTNLGFFDEGRSSLGYSTKVFGDIGLSLSYLLRRQRTSSTADWQRTSVVNLGIKVDL